MLKLFDEKSSNNDSLSKSNYLTINNDFNYEDTTKKVNNNLKHLMKQYNVKTLNNLKEKNMLNHYSLLLDLDRQKDLKQAIKNNLNEVKNKTFNNNNNNNNNKKKRDKIANQINFLLNELDLVPTTRSNPPVLQDNMLYSFKNFILIKELDKVKSGISPIKVIQDSFEDKISFFHKVKSLN